MNETPIQQFYGLPYDRWEGYAFERVKLLNALDNANVSHLVFLTTDHHCCKFMKLWLAEIDNQVAFGHFVGEILIGRLCF